MTIRSGNAVLCLGGSTVPIAHFSVEEYRIGEDSLTDNSPAPGPIRVSMKGWNEVLADRILGWRPVCARRARKLRKRGERVEWRPALDSLAWMPGERGR
ncbi:hypothetical protein NFG57_11060 [Halomonas sp. H10-59]|uniref:Uncharacterized protein n=1 Tax=Halomonas sp. H10-59 TaxID=2950874 RepID=A0AAU7KP76_9GAMM